MHCVHRVGQVVHLAFVWVAAAILFGCASTTHGSIEDVSALPSVGDDGRAGYERFLRIEFHRAFAISKDGSWAYASDPVVDNAIKRSLAACQERAGYNCLLYAVDQCVVLGPAICDDARGNIAEAQASYERGDYLNAFSEFWLLALAGNATAQYYVGESYEHNRGVAFSFDEAYRWYMTAAENGYPHGWCRAGMLAQTQTGRTYYNPANGQALVRKAAEQGDPEAQYRLGEWYRLGVDMKSDPEQAEFWHQRAAAQGYKPSKEVLDDVL